MIPVRVRVSSEGAHIEYIVHVTNRSRSGLDGAVRAAWKRYPNLRSVVAEYTDHDCTACNRTHTISPHRSPFPPEA